MEKATTLKWLGVLALLLSLLLAACGPAVSPDMATATAVAEESGVDDMAEEETVAEETGATEETTAPETDTGAEAEPVPTVPIFEDATLTESGLQYIEVVEGEGPAPEEGDLITMHYAASLGDGTELDSSYEIGEPVTFIWGRGMIIPGLEEGIGLLKEGSEAKIIIPPQLAYGDVGAGGGMIPPNATLIFDVEVLSVEPAPEVPESPTEIDGEYETTENGVQYYDIVEGDGAVAEPGQLVSVHYTGWLAEDGTRFDSSLERGTPFQFILGAGQVIPGWDEGVQGMRVGGKRQLLIPSELGYGETGAGATIPPNADLIFDVELLDVNEPPQ